MWLVANHLWREGYRFPFDARGYARITGAAMAAALIGGTIVLALPAGLSSSGFSFAVTVATFTLSLRVFRPFVLEERRAIESLVGCRIVLL